jgi:LysR family transcriptional activator of nhaA
MLVPGMTASVRPQFETWLTRHQLHPHIVGEFDDGALMKAFGQGGAGVFIAPTVLEAEIRSRYAVKTLGRTDEISEEFFAISVERRVTHPCVAAITAAARDRLFASRRPG